MPNLNVRIRNRLRLIYVVTDLVTTNLGMLLFNVFRWSMREDMGTFGEFYHFPRVLWGQLLFPLMMMGIYWLSGYYNYVERRSRAAEAVTTATSAFIGSLCIFFLAVVNDSTWSRTVVFEFLFMAFAIIFTCVYLGRLVITLTECRRLQRRHHTGAAVMLGTDGRAADLARRIREAASGDGFAVQAFVRLNEADDIAPAIGDAAVIELGDLGDYCRNHAVNQLIVTSAEMPRGADLASLIRLAADLDGSLYVWPDVNAVALTSRRAFNVVGEPLVCISRPNIPYSSANVKRAADIVGSALALVVLSPVLLALAIGVKRDSKGPVFFRQQRLGYGGKPFEIIKFRSMIENAEADGRARVTVDDDPRVTRFGRFLRKYRLDELPQFWNVLKGEMSLVGPRPERRYFAEQIASRVPLYPLLYQVRPGITSWGMVRFGYASDVDQMVERLRYDLIYLENISILTDVKILLHTVRTVLSGRGK